jgi:hypothetical protein
MAFSIRFLQLKQLQPFAADSAKVFGQFEVTGIKPEFVQIYGILGIGLQPGTVGNATDTVDLTIKDVDYTFTLDLVAGAIYTIWLCPRSGSKESPDDQMDGVYWEAYCVSQTIVTQSTGQAAGQRPPPHITALEAQLATLSQPERIVVRWQAPQPYGKYLIAWAPNASAVTG